MLMLMKEQHNFHTRLSTYLKKPVSSMCWDAINDRISMYSGMFVIPNAFTNKISQHQAPDYCGLQVSSSHLHKECLRRHSAHVNCKAGGGFNALEMTGKVYLASTAFVDLIS